MKLDVFEGVEESTKMGEWSQLAKHMVDQFFMAASSKDPNKRRTICMNQTRGNSIFHAVNDLDAPMTQTYLFLVNKSTEMIG